MSIRSTLASFVMRHTIKKHFKEITDADELRAKLAETLAQPKLPNEVTTESVDIDGVAGEWVSWGDEPVDKVLLYLHGGGYVFGTYETYRDLNWRLCKEAGLRVLAVDYRLAPENPFPAAVDDATAAYRFLLDSFDASDISIAGDSAGGGLTAALLVNLKNQGLPQPAKAVLISPWLDLALTGETMETNAEADAMLSREACTMMASHYLGDRDAKAPLASPLYADVSGLCPMMLIVGDTEVLLSDSTRFVEKLEAAGVAATLKVWPKVPHVFPAFAARIPEGKTAISDMAAFLKG